MTGIYLEKKEIKENEEIKEIKNMEFFIGSLDEKALVKIDGIAAISESALANSDVESILFSNCSKSIGKSAFENCDKLKTVIFGKLGENDGDEKATSTLKNVKLASADDGLGSAAGGDEPPQSQEPASADDGLGSTAGGDEPPQPQKSASADDNLTIQTNAFKGCSQLTTLILPEIGGTLTIEKDAFSGCEKLRAVVAVCGNADFTENPFSGCPAHLTFVCKKDSDKKNFEVARFARENGYRSVYAD